MIETGAFRASATRGRSEQVEHALRRAIVLGELPPGAVLRELDLAQQHNCAQGTIREALMRLSEEGLINRRPRRDTHVATALPDDAEELLRIRHGIECRAARRVAPMGDEELLDDLNDLLQSMRFAAFQQDEYALLEYDGRFHLRLFEAAETQVVVPVLQRCLVHSQRYKILNTSPESRDLVATANRHVAILDALATRDPDALELALSHHIATIVDFGPDVIRGEPERAQ